MTNCNNCGAPLEQSVCAYCGSRFDVQFVVEPDQEVVAVLYADGQVVDMVTRMRNVFSRVGILSAELDASLNPLRGGSPI